MARRGYPSEFRRILPSYVQEHSALKASQLQRSVATGPAPVPTLDPAPRIDLSQQEMAASETSRSSSTPPRG